MSTLITGGAGYIGSHMVWNMLDNGEVPVVIDALTTGMRTAIPQDVPFYAIDIADQDQIENVLVQHNINSVIHFAGSTSVYDSAHDPLHYYRNNSDKTSKLVDICVAAGVENFIFSSSAAIYGNPTSQAPVTEDTPAFPLSPYGFSKLLSERLLTQAAQAHNGFNTAILRYFNVVGADLKGRTGQCTKGNKSLFKVICETAVGEQAEIVINGSDYETPDGTCVRDYIHVNDLASAHRATLQKMHETGQNYVYNCGYGKGYSVLDVIEAMEQVTGTPIDHIMGPRREGDIASITADNKKILSNTDWKVEFDDLKLMLQSAYQWELQQREESIRRTA